MRFSAGLRGSAEPGANDGRERRERAAAVADRVLLGRAQLGGGHVVTLRAGRSGHSRTRRCPPGVAAPIPARRPVRRVRSRRRTSAAAQTNWAARSPAVAQFLEQHGEVVGVHSRPRIPCGVDARGAAQRIDADPRVVGERRQAGVRGRGARLDQRVLVERDAVLDRLRAVVADELEPGKLRRQDARSSSTLCALCVARTSFTTRTSRAPTSATRGERSSCRRARGRAARSVRGGRTARPRRCPAPRRTGRGR